MRIEHGRVALVAVVVGAWLAGCSGGAPAPTGTAGAGGPDGIIEEFRLTETSAGERNWTLRAKRALVYDSQNQVQVFGVTVDFYEAGGKHYSTLTCDSGTVNQNTNDMTATGRVDIHTVEGTHVEAPVLQFWNARQRITSDAQVKVTDANGSVVQGTGFDSDVKVEHYRVGKVNATLKQSDTR